MATVAMEMVAFLVGMVECGREWVDLWLYDGSGNDNLDHCDDVDGCR